MLKRIIVITLIAALIGTSVGMPILAQPSREAYNAGFEAGREDGPKDVGYLKIFWGAILGPLAMFFTLLESPHVPDDRVLRVTDQGNDFLDGYLDGYRRAFKEQALMYNLIGWSSWLMFAVISSELDEWDHHDRRVESH